MADPALKTKPKKKRKNMEAHVDRVLSRRVHTVDERDRQADKEARKLEARASSFTVPTDSMIERVCARIALGQTLRSISQTKGFPCLSDLLAWMHPDERTTSTEVLTMCFNFQESYAVAMKRQRELDMHDLREVADMATGKDDAPAVRLRVETRQWLLERNDPDRFAKASKVIQAADPAIALAANLPAAIEILWARKKERNLKPGRVLDALPAGQEPETIEDQGSNVDFETCATSCTTDVQVIAHRQSDFSDSQDG